MKAKRNKLGTVLLVLLLALLLAACGTQGPDETGQGDPPGPAEGPVWTAEGMPVRVQYDRMWEYGDFAESEDPELIDGLVAALKSLEVGEPTQMMVEDFTDILTFTLEDGTEYRLVFEENIWVKSEEERYLVEGLGNVRTLLDRMMDEE